MTRAETPSASASPIRPATTKSTTSRRATTASCSKAAVTTSNYLTEFYDDQPDLDSAQQVAVTSGSETTGIDAEMVAAGSIQGTVTDSGTNPLESVCVVAYDSGGSYKTVAYTDASGEYSIRNLDTGEYRLEFYNCGSPANVLPEYYNDKDSNQPNRFRSCAESRTTGINVELAIGWSDPAM